MLKIYEIHYITDYDNGSFCVLAYDKQDAYHIAKSQLNYLGIDDIDIVVVNK